MGLSYLWQGFRNVCTKQTRTQAVLLKAVSAPEKLTVLYDLEVEDDHSFIIEGLVVHNSNCRCKIRAKQVSIREYLKLSRTMKSRVEILRGMKAASLSR